MPSHTFSLLTLLTVFSISFNDEDYADPHERYLYRGEI